MGRLYVASVLISLSGKGQSTKVAEEQLAPIVPGAWAAWAKSYEVKQTTAPAKTPASAPATTILQPSGSGA